jgi:hypothetical protein
MSAAVTIRKGEITPRTRPDELRPSEWKRLTSERRGYLAVHLPNDCRMLLEFVEDAEQIYRECGYGSIEDYIRSGLELDPEQVGWAIDGLRRMKPDEPIPYQHAVELGKRGRPKKGEEKGCNATLKRGTAAHWLARLDRDGHTELAAKVRAGKLSANAAAIEAGFRKQTTALERVLKLLPKLTRTERRELRARIEALDEAVPS